MKNENILRLVSRLFDEHVWETVEGNHSVVVGKEHFLDALRFKLNQRELLIELMNEDEE